MHHHRTPIGGIWMELTEENRKRLAKIMVIQNVSQRELAKAVGWKSHTYLGRLLKGTIKTLDPDAAIKISLYLGVGVDDLFVARTSYAVERIAQHKKTLVAA